MIAYVDQEVEASADVACFLSVRYLGDASMEVDLCRYTYSCSDGLSIANGKGLARD